MKIEFGCSRPIPRIIKTLFVKSPLAELIFTNNHTAGDRVQKIFTGQNLPIAAGAQPAGSGLTIKNDLHVFGGNVLTSLSDLSIFNPVGKSDISYFESPKNVLQTLRV